MKYSDKDIFKKIQEILEDWNGKWVNHKESNALFIHLILIKLIKEHLLEGIEKENYI